MKMNSPLKLAALGFALAMACEAPAAEAPTSQQKSGEKSEAAKLEAIVEQQRHMDAANAELTAEIDRGRRFRDMLWEASVLSDLNLGWVQDQLEHWTCAVGEQKREEAKERRAEEAGRLERLRKLCAQIKSAGERHACEGWQQDTERRIAVLDGLAHRYETECPTGGK